MFKKLYEKLFNWDQKEPARLTDTPSKDTPGVEVIVPNVPVVSPNTQPSDVYKIDTTDRKIVKWTPNDALQHEYNKASRIVGSIPAITYRIKENKKKIESLNAQARKHLEKEDLTPLDRFHILELKQDIMKEEDKVASSNMELEAASAYQNDPIFERWGEYMSNAEKFIKDNPRLRGFIGVNDILNSEGIFFKCKALMDSAKFSVKDEDQLNKLATISTFFDMTKVHEQARGRHLKEFAEFMKGKVKDAQILLFDQLDAEALGSATTLLTMENTKPYEKIEDNETLVNNEEVFKPGESLTALLDRIAEPIASSVPEVPASTESIDNN